MNRKIFTTTALVAALMTGSVGQARADVGSAIAGGIIGGIIGGAIQGQRRPTRTTRYVVPSAARQEAREVQTALNHFYFNVGTPDGVLGRQSRAGISQYQAYLGFPVTGTLAVFERQVLISAYQRAQIGGPEVTRVTQRHQDGLRGLLTVVRDEMQGGGTRIRSAGAYGLPGEVADAVDEIAASSDPTAEQLVQRSGFVQLSDLNGDGRTDYIIDTSVTGSAFWCNAQACTVQVFVSTPDGYRRNDFQSNNATPAMFDCQQSSCRLNEGGTTTVAALGGQGDSPLAPPVSAAQPMVQNPNAAAPGVTATGGGMPNFFGGGSRPAQTSLASHCNRVGLVTSANGGYSDVNTMTDPVFTLNEQFCLARGYAIADGEAMMAQLGVAPQDVAGQCAGLATALQANVSALSLQPRDVVLAGMTQWMLTSGMSTSDLAMNARVCLSSGYATDNLPVALGSALILTALGETAYGELPAHHLMQGIGAVQRRDLAADWFTASIPTAMTTEVAFQPGPASRNALIMAAVNGATGSAPSMAAPVQAQVQTPVAPAASK
ncbi:peptidoglycan-binding domain-containing protein [Pararhodobacter zhoushanensis]|uniref:peptidoglycan-binding domain-containing protein n=1 Tax=Pararhodobacter zhoushanensis TaxID=2479545 RepID=UPI000F8E3231|nr:peptidoglycan-binding domain-containing protein [Pararhodobacter zhoushanensis]